MVTYSVRLFLHLARAHSLEPAVQLALLHLRWPATVQQKVITHEVPMLQRQYKGMMPAFKGQAGQRGGEESKIY